MIHMPGSLLPASFKFHSLRWLQGQWPVPNKGGVTESGTLGGNTTTTVLIPLGDESAVNCPSVRIEANPASTNFELGPVYRLGLTGKKERR